MQTTTTPRIRNKAPLRVLLATAATLAVPLAWAATGYWLQPYMDRVPALPTTPAAAGKAFAGTRFDPPKSAAMEQLQKDLGAQAMQSTQMSTGATPAGAMTQAQGEELAKKMQSMTQEQRVAYAMQMAQQQQAQQAGPRAFALDDKGAQAAKRMGQLQTDMGMDQRAMNDLSAQITKFTQGWEIEDEALLKSAPLPEACDAATRAKLVQTIQAHVTLAQTWLGKAQPLEASLRKEVDTLAARDRDATELNDALAASPLHSRSVMIAGMARRNAISGVTALSQLYEGTGRAAKWQHVADWANGLPAAPRCGIQ